MWIVNTVDLGEHSYPTGEMISMSVLIFIIIVHVCTCNRKCGGYGTVSKSHFFPSILWIPGIEMRLPSLVSSAFPCWVSPAPEWCFKKEIPRDITYCNETAGHMASLILVTLQSSPMTWKQDGHTGGNHIREAQRTVVAARCSLGLAPVGRLNLLSTLVLFSAHWHCHL